LKKYISKSNCNLKNIVFTVTNELNYDQRMIRICNSLSEDGFNIILIGVAFNNSPALKLQKFNQKRIYCIFKKGILFYVEFNLRLFLKLLFLKTDAICCIDLDTIIPVYFAGKLKKRILIYDAHEYFSQMKEVISRKNIYRFWHTIEKLFVPRFKNGYTVGYNIAKEFKQLYGVNYSVIMNTPKLIDQKTLPVHEKKKIIIYQGAVNHARGLESLIPAMKEVAAELHIYGDGNIMHEIKSLIIENNLSQKVLLKGKVSPTELSDITTTGYIGINLVEYTGLNQYYSLANKFFDYTHAEIPQVTMNFPEYKKINDEFEVAILIDDLQIISIQQALNKLLNDAALYHRLALNCNKAKQLYNWQNEENKLKKFYHQIFE